MVDIASRSGGATLGLVYDIHHIATSILWLIGEEHRICTCDEETSTSYGPSIRSPMSPTVIRMYPIRGHGRARRFIDETMLPPSTSSTLFAPEASTSPSSTAPHVIPLSLMSPPSPPLEATCLPSSMSPVVDTTDECKTHLCFESISQAIFEYFISKFM